MTDEHSKNSSGNKESGRIHAKSIYSNDTQINKLTGFSRKDILEEGND